VRWVRVKRDAGVAMNERCDRLALAVRDAAARGIDPIDDPDALAAFRPAVA